MISEQMFCLHKKGEKNPAKREDIRKKMSNAHKGKKPWNKGKTLSEEAKRKISEANKGKHWKLINGKRVWY